MAIRHIKISGPFTDEEVAQFIALLRRIDDANQTAIYVLTVADPDATMDESERLVREALPPLPERATSFARASYRDDRYPSRLCDFCGNEYRGPAVYCSLECAMADA